MKTYMFRDLCWATCFTLGFVMAFIYGLIWLNKGFKVEEFSIENKVYVDSKISELKRSIMPSAFKGERKK